MVLLLALVCLIVGVGLFKGSAPTVWLANPYANNGISYTDYLYPSQFSGFSPNPDAQFGLVTDNGVRAGATQSVDFVDKDLKLPSGTTLAVDDCVLVGHSDGGTIALDYAANDAEPLRAVVTLAAHAINEPVCVAAIHRAREAYATGELRARLAKYHGDNVDRAFHLWSDAWVAPGFEPMDANGRLPRIEVPVQVIQGEDEEVLHRRTFRGGTGRDWLKISRLIEFVLSP